MSTKVVQITNIAPQATKDQMQNLFGCIGKIDEIRLYPTVRDVTCPVVSRVCYVKFFESSCVAVAQHLTNTVFIDRALIVCPVSAGSIPDEFKALELINNGSGIPGLPSSDAQLPPEVVNRVEGIHPFQVIKTSDPKLEEFNLPEYPPLPISFDARKIEEIRRTVIVIDIPADWEIQEILDHFAQAGEVKYARFAEKSRQKHVMIEFCEQKSVVRALKMQGTEFLGKRLNIYHSMQAIIKPEAKSNEAAQREVEEAMSFVKETQNVISTALDGILAKEKSVPHRHTRSKSHERERRTRTRSRSRSRSTRKSSRRSRSRSKRKKSRSRSKSRKRSKRSRSRSHSHSKRKRSDREKRSTSRYESSRYERSRSRDRSRRDRERSRRDRSRSRDREHSRRERETAQKSSRRAKSRSRSRDRRHKETSSSSSHRRDDHRSSRDDHRRDDDHRSSSSRVEKDRRERRRSRERSRSKESRKTKRISEEKPRERDYDAEEKIGTEDSKKDSSDDASPEKSDNMDISNSP